MTIQHYNPSTQKFEQPPNYKVRKLLELGKISKIAEGIWMCRPILGYNSTTYTVREDAGRLFCDCQMGRKGRDCSHAAAVRLYRERTEAREEQLKIL